MNKIITLISICFIFFSNSVEAQKLEYETTSPWFWGMNVGAAWNTTDVKNHTNYGWGITLGRSFNFDYGNTFSFDLRGRYLGGQWKGQDVDSVGFLIPNKTLSSGFTNYDSLLGYGVNNFAAKAHELDLELVLHFNRLVAARGIDPYIFGGIGLTWYNTRGNLIDGTNETLYDYNSLDNFSKSSIKGLLDDSYETPLDGSTNQFNVGVMPSLGVGLGYFFSPNFSMGFEHKTTFSLVDNFDGYLKPNASDALFKNDIYHYTNVYFKYYFKHRGDTRVDDIQDNTDNNNFTNGNGDCQKPIIRINNPGNNLVVKDPNLVLNADVAHTTSRDNITVTVNGVNTTNFNYTTTTNKLQGTSYLQVGQNTVTITATNACGSTSETIYVTYDMDCQTPIVRFTNPANSGGTVNSNTLYVTADVMNLTKNAALTFNVNGISVSNYSFNASTGKFSATINLKEGQNTIELFATNNCGTGSSAAVINYAVNCPAPIIQSINTASGAIVNSSTYVFEAQLKNVPAANQVSVKVNGASQGQGQYNSTKGWYQQTLRLNPGQNIIEITTTNNCGTATQTVVINYEVPCVAPTASIVSPSTAGQNVTVANYSFVGQVANVANASEISLIVNGVSIQGFNFNASTGKVTRTITLQQGANTIELKVANKCGTALDYSEINYNYSCPKPTVQFIAPVNNPTVLDANFIVQAFVSNISSANQVTLKVNGVIKSGGTFTASNSMHKNTVALQEGNNTIELIATNSCGNATAVATIVRKVTPTVEIAPVITMTGTCDATVEAGQHYISGFISNISSSNQVSVSVNNVVIQNVTYAAVNQSLNFGFNLPVSLNPDTYVIVITAQNTGGVVTKTCVIRVNKPEEKITICHIPPGNNGNPQTIEIPLSAWPAHQAHGDKLGACAEVVDKDIVICVKVNGKQTTMTIKQSQWPAYQAKGATLGKCPEIVDEDIIICVPVNGKPTTMTIKQSQWGAYQAKGATLGKCPEIVDEDIQICVEVNGKLRTVTIKQSQWPAYQAKGAVLGSCAPVGSGSDQDSTSGTLPGQVNPDIAICIEENGVRVTKIIKSNELEAYLKLGATEGPCDNQRGKQTLERGGVVKPRGTRGN